jgi:hypothetical protein
MTRFKSTGIQLDRIAQFLLLRVTNPRRSATIHILEVQRQVNGFEHHMREPQEPQCGSPPAGVGPLERNNHRETPRDCNSDVISDHPVA